MHLARFVALTGGIEAVDQLYAASRNGHAGRDHARGGQVFRPRAADGGGAEGERGATRRKGRRRKTGSARMASAESIARQAALRFRPNQPPAAAPDQHIRNRAVGQCANPKISPVLLPVADDPTISFRLWFRVGSQDDPPGKEGLAAITAAMISEGATQTNSYEQILDKLFPLAAGYSASAGTEMTVDLRPGPQRQSRPVLSAVDRGHPRAGLQAGRPRPDQEPDAQLPGKHPPLCQRRGVGQGGALQHDLRRHAPTDISAQGTVAERPRSSRLTT